jgi:hypothetical protein
MKFAVIDNDTRLVTDIVEAEEASFVSLFFPNKAIVLVTENTNEPCVGLSYNAEKQKFEQPKLLDSWVLDEETLMWKPPKEYPNDGPVYYWEESILDWAVSPIQE